MLTNLSLMKVKLWFEDSQFRANKNISRKAEYEKALAALTSVPTTASRASLTLDGRFVFSLASSLVWSTVQRFELHGNIDVPSLFVILAQMPRLQHLALGFTAPYLNAFYKKSSAESKQAGKQVHVANRSLSYLSVKLGMRTKLAKGTLQPFLSDLLPLVPVLSILRAYPNLVDVVKKIVADPNDSLQEAAQHLEVVGE
ncbi:hypothetical protein GGI12_005323 [Dipsacomyces acuminosporus]|nr:hypothetical protein GGI12_005323 [Dipsacomyces acuminosporus]